MKQVVIIQVITKGDGGMASIYDRRASLLFSVIPPQFR